MPKGSLKKLYTSLTENNINIGTFEEFSKKMQKSSRRNKFHTVITENNINIGTFEEFESKILPDIEQDKGDYERFIEQEKIRNPDLIGKLNSAVKTDESKQVVESIVLQGEKIKDGGNGEAKPPTHVGELVKGLKESPVTKFASQFIRSAAAGAIETGEGLSDILRRGAKALEDAGIFIPPNATEEELQIIQENQQRALEEQEAIGQLARDIEGEPTGIAEKSGAAIGRLAEFIGEMSIGGLVTKPIVAAKALKVASKIPAGTKIGQITQAVVNKALQTAPTFTLVEAVRREGDAGQRIENGLHGLKLATTFAILSGIPGGIISAGTIARIPLGNWLLGTNPIETKRILEDPNISEEDKITRLVDTAINTWFTKSGFTKNSLKGLKSQLGKLAGEKFVKPINEQIDKLEKEPDISKEIEALKAIKPKEEVVTEKPEAPEKITQPKPAEITPAEVGKEVAKPEKPVEKPKVSNFEKAKIEGQKKVDKIGEEFRPVALGEDIDAMRSAIKRTAKKYNVEYDKLRKEILFEPKEITGKVEVTKEKQPFEMTKEERQQKIKELKEENKIILSTPLMTEGAISETQILRMGKRERKEWQSNTMKKMRIQDEIKELGKSDEQLQAEKDNRDKRKATSRLLQIKRQLEMLNIVGIGKSGKIKPSHQKTIDIVTKERDDLLTKFPELQPEKKQEVIGKEKPATKPLRPSTQDLIEKQKKKKEFSVKKMHSGFAFPKGIQEKIDKVQELTIGKASGKIEQKSWELFRDYYEKKEGLKFRKRQEVDEILTGFNKDNLEDAIFYRQKTRNIFKGETDTFEDVSKRLPDNLKKVIDKEVAEHIENMRKIYNDSPWTKDINAREEVAETYLTGIYSGKIKGKNAYEYLVGLKGRQFVTNNFMRNKKTYLNFAEAFDKAGYIPRFRNLAEQLKYQDDYMVRLLANSELIGRIKDFEKDIEMKLIVRPNNKKLYDEAKSNPKEWIPYDDIYLRSYVAGKKPDGSLIWATSRAPALIHKELSDVIQSVFTKDAYKPENIGWRIYDTATSYLRYSHVALSGWHPIPLTESFVGGRGLRGVLNFPRIIRRNQQLLKNTDFMTKALGSGLKIGGLKEAGRHRVERDIKSLINKLEIKGGVRGAIGKGLEIATLPQFTITKFIFEKLLPNYKIGMFYDYETRYLQNLNKKGIVPSPEKMKEIDRGVASIVNDQFGVQAWELQRIFNNPKAIKWMHRTVQYPDWTISALRQAFGALELGIRGDIARRYWLRYGIAFFTVQNALSYLFTGYYNDEKGNIRWSLEKSHSTFENKDPLHKLNFQLPDIDLTIAGNTFNPGRELKDDGTYGRRYYSHFGKQMLEIPRYVTAFGSQVFSKGNPVVQLLLTQWMGGKPFKGGIFPARGDWVGGQFIPWGGKKGYENLKERIKQFLEDVSPYSLGQARQGKYVGAGLMPISKGLSSFVAREYIEIALKNNNEKLLEDIKITLRLNNYPESSIKRAITIVKNKIANEKGEEKPKSDLKFIP